MAALGRVPPRDLFAQLPHLLRRRAGHRCRRAREYSEASATGPGVDPEQAFVAALSACHMLWFLHLATQRKWVVESYVDEAVSILDRTWISKVTLRPTVTFSGNKPTEEEHAAAHHRAHEKCFIANSVKTQVMVEPCLK